MASIKIDIPRAIMEANLKSSTKLVWLGVLNEIKPGRYFAEISAEVLAPKVGLCERTTHNCLNDLVEKGHLIRKPHRGAKKLFGPTTIMYKKLTKQ